MFIETLLRMSDEIFFSFLIICMSEFYKILKQFHENTYSEIWDAEASLLLNMIEAGEIFLEQSFSSQEAFSSSVIVSGPW